MENQENYLDTNTTMNMFNEFIACGSTDVKKIEKKMENKENYLDTNMNMFNEFAAYDSSNEKKMVTNEKKSVGENMNMFNEFAKINISGNENINQNKIVKNKKFMHGKNVVFTCGQYKGYNGFVYEFNSESLEVEIDEYDYVMAGEYGECKNGDMIKTKYGNSEIINGVDKMYALQLKTKDNLEIRLFADQINQFLCIYEDKMKKVVQIVNKYEKNETMYYDIVKLDLDYKKYYNNEEIMGMLANVICNDKYESIKMEMVNEVELNGEEFCMVIKKPVNKNDRNFIGTFGKLKWVIPEQYLVRYKRNVLVNSNTAIVNGKNVVFKSGYYANRSGTLKKTNGNNLVIGIDAIGKKVSSHIMIHNESYTSKRISSDDLFFKDIELKNGNYFQVNQCVESKIGKFNVFSGVEKIDNDFVMKTIKEDDECIKALMPGFCVTLPANALCVKGMQNVKTVPTCEKDKTNLDMIMDTIEENPTEETDDVDDEQDVDGSYNDEGDNAVNIVYDAEVEMKGGEVEMKESFKDSERLGFIQRVLSKDEKSNMKMIEKCLIALSFQLENALVYSILENINDAIIKMKSELNNLSIIDWKTSDTKYIVACLVIYEILKSGCNLSKTSFKNFVLKLYESAFFKKNDITDTIFLKSDEKTEIPSCFDLIKMNNEKRIEMKKHHKSGKIVEIVYLMMDNCNIILQSWFGTIAFSFLNEERDIFPVQKKIKESKRFLTTQDLLDDNIVETAKRVMWGPNSLRMVKIWKSSLVRNCDQETDEKMKLVYKFVIDNFENAPIVLQKIKDCKDDWELLKYNELKRAFDLFMLKLKKFNSRMENDKNDLLKKNLDEKEKISKRRVEIELTNNFGKMNFDKKIKV